MTSSPSLHWDLIVTGAFVILAVFLVFVIVATKFSLEEHKNRQFLARALYALNKAYILTTSGMLSFPA